VHAGLDHRATCSGFSLFGSLKFMIDNYHLSIINVVYDRMANQQKSPKSAKKSSKSDKPLETLKNAPFGPAEEEAALLMGWLPVQVALKADLDAIYKRAQQLTRMARSENTRRSYRTAWQQYENWCHGVGFEPLSGDPGMISLFLSMLSLKVVPSTLKARLAAISVAHRLAGIPLDTNHAAIRLVMRGAAKEKGLAPTRQARPLLYETLPVFVDTFDDSPLDVRNKAILLLGFGGALRRSEIAALQLSDIVFKQDRLIIVLPRSKGDRYGRSETIVVAKHPTRMLCPSASPKDWLTLRGRETGPLFLRANRNQTFRQTGISDQTINRLIKTAAQKAQLTGGAYSGHSLRAGFATSASDAGCDLKTIMGQTRLRAARQALQYIRRPQDHLEHNASALLFQQTRS